MKKLLVVLLLIASACVASAQAPNDVPSDHWAYEAVQSLVDKGYIQGYPDGSFRGDRTLSRYEFATMIKRCLDGVNESLAQAKSAQPASAPTAPAAVSPTGAALPQISKEDLATISKLVDEFKIELTVIGTRLDNVEATVAELRSQVANINSIVTDEEGPLETARTDIKKLQKVAISGFIQARYTVMNDFNDPKKSRQAAANDFTIRRARAKFTMKPTYASTFVFEVDSGGNNTGASSVSTKDVWASYALSGDSAFGYTLKMGQMKWPFGYESPNSDTTRETPERSLIVQRFMAGERDRGLSLSSATSKKLTYTLGVFSGTGAGNAENNRSRDFVGNVRYPATESLDLGASVYIGRGFKNSAAAVIQDNKTRYGADLQYYMDKITVKAEYIRGRGCEGTLAAFNAKEWVDGGWAQIAYNVRKKTTLVAKWETLSVDPLYTSYGRRSSWNFGIVQWMDDATRFKVFFQKNEETTNSFKNDSLIAEWMTVL